MTVPSPRVYRIATPAEMHALGRWLGERTRPGDLVVLAGPLGAGKTVLVQGIGTGLGVTGPITSPTFVIARVHPDGRIPLVHVDAYRLASVDEVDDLDLDASAEESVTVVEWGGGLVESLADAHLRIEIERDIDEPDSPAVDPVEDFTAEPRLVRLVPHGGDWAVRLG